MGFSKDFSDHYAIVERKLSDQGIEKKVIGQQRLWQWHLYSFLRFYERVGVLLCHDMAQFRCHDDIDDGDGDDDD